MKVVVTGAAGYIGASTVELLLGDGHEVIGIDSLMHGGQSLIHLADHERLHFVKADVRDAEVVRPWLQDADALVHLAAIVGDPACKIDPDHTRSVNYHASVNLHGWAELAVVHRFIFASAHPKLVTWTTWNKLKRLGEARKPGPEDLFRIISGNVTALQPHIKGKLPALKKMD